jgi:hypothetical protein
MVANPRLVAVRWFYNERFRSYVNPVTVFGSPYFWPEPELICLSSIHAFLRL